jgi:steroid delta-isomerase
VAQQAAKTVERYFSAIRSLNLDAWVSTFEEEAISEDPVGSPPIQGHDELRNFFLGLTDLFSRVGITEDSVFICGNDAAVKWTGYGVGKNGAQVEFEGIDVFQLSDAGKIVRLRSYWDPAPTIARLKA